MFSMHKLSVAFASAKISVISAKSMFLYKCSQIEKFLNDLAVGLTNIPFVVEAIKTCTIINKELFYFKQRISFVNVSADKDKGSERT